MIIIKKFNDFNTDTTLNESKSNKDECCLPKIITKNLTRSIKDILDCHDHSNGESNIMSEIDTICRKIEKKFKDTDIKPYFKKVSKVKSKQDFKDFIEGVYISLLEKE